MKKTIFLTNNLEDELLDKRSVSKLSNELMFSVAPAYRSPSRFVNVRRRFDGKKIAYDSGGFSFLIGKLKEPPDPRRTALVYRVLGFTENDFLIQLDLPPGFNMPKEQRLALIRKSAQFYHVMVNELKGATVLPVVHGWSEDEILESLSLVMDGDKLTVGSFTTSMGVVWPAKVAAEKMAVGTYAASSVIATHGGQAERVLQRAPRDIVFRRLATALNILRKHAEEIFVLGASNINTTHLAFLLGARYTDGSAWRLAAMLHVIFVVELGRFSIGEKRISKPLNEVALAKMHEVWKHPLNPFKDMSIEEFLAKARQNNTEGFTYRALWNAFQLKLEEEIANQYACNPDGYLKYLKKRWQNNSFWRSVLKLVQQQSKLYVQPSLEIFLKQQLP